MCEQSDILVLGTESSRNLAAWYITHHDVTSTIRCTATSHFFFFIDFPTYSENCIRISQKPNNQQDPH